ncbi:carboxylesterase 1-like [Solanum dulcamara]|uniref:carboxylesterase 1-like n=1 Tax=Solanum dulcamara TaxID=45834 RepID=UPI002486BF4B|nr:carboxylesterase 1-like [Solanum dulcamara]XP_055814947.1 carboxylesterase 1-like [Solanum dulcamara]
MSDQIAPVDPNVDPYGYLGIIPNTDGSITRSQIPTRPFSTTIIDNDSSIVYMKDLVINPTKGTMARIIIPREVLNSENKLPLVVYFHGGGFVMAITVDTPILQKFCATLAAKIPAIIVSVDYRYAPENRLPAAYDDCMESLHWIKNTPNELLKTYADFSKCFLLGTSSGGNIAYHVGLRVAGVSEYLKPLEIKGLILYHSLFGGNERTKLELRLARDKMLPLNVSDIMWELGLPIGSDHDHPYCNPMVEILSNEDLFDQVKTQGWKILMIDCDGNPLIDRQIEVSKMLKEKGVQVVDCFSEGGFHGCEYFDGMKLKELTLVVKEFLRA